MQKTASWKIKCGTLHNVNGHHLFDAVEVFLNKEMFDVHSKFVRSVLSDLFLDVEPTTYRISSIAGGPAP